MTVMFSLGLSSTASAEPPSLDRLEALRRMNSAELAALIEPLIESLNSENTDVRRKAARELYWVAYYVPVRTGSVDALINALRDEDRTVRADVARTLGFIGPQAKVAVLDLITVLIEDEYWFARSSAAGSLCQIGPAARAAVPVLIETMKDPMEGLRQASALALGGFGPDAKAAVPALIEALEDSFHVSGSAANALGKIDPGADAAIAVIVDAIENGETFNRRHAAFQAGLIGPNAKAIAPTLAKALNDGNAKLRIAAAESLQSSVANEPVRLRSVPMTDASLLDLRR